MDELKDRLHLEHDWRGRRSLVCVVLGHQHRGSVPKAHVAEVYCLRCGRVFWRFGCSVHEKMETRPYAYSG